MIGKSNATFVNLEELKILINGISKISYNGITSKTLDITLASLGAAASNHTHDTIYSKLSHIHEYLPLSGGVMSAGSSVKREYGTVGKYAIHISDNVAMTAFMHDTYEGIVTGIIKITLPGWYTNTMMTFEVMIWNYIVNTSTILHISGYNYDNDYNWYQPTVVLDNSSLVSNVRFGDDGTHCCILIDSITGTWRYPVITITKLLTAFYNSEIFRTGIEISIIPDDSGFNNTLYPNTPLIIQKPNY